ncbi:hypothetical protein COA17_11060 [Sphingomonas ginsenosidimutans]|jgi:hypothetical protein|uniref:Uncharacterized protein n=1 Tax=Sphingomonas ginsenosidimutans TaxID=862134 RepID=A0A2A4HYC6_9SPHN|nr:hypothetical protein [Sphingomonas ginsenosidimutans]PCG08688.1 hypothetical protein COA17_11060 [Sphingomonas ginsenosidimutans]
MAVNTNDPTIRQTNVAVLFGLQVDENTPLALDPTLHAIPVEADSVTYGTPWTQEDSNEATGSYVAGAPLIIGQSTPISFRFRIKGAGPNVVYSSTVKPPHHAVLQAAGWRGQFQAAIAAAVATAGTATSVTLAAGFPGVARALLGSMLLIGAGTGAGSAAAVIEYSAGRVATLADSFTPPLDATTSVSVPASWTYAQTSPSDPASRLVDHPTASVAIYRDGTLANFTAVRGTISLEGSSAKPGYGTFNGTGIFAGRVDAAIPGNIVIASHSAPVLVQGADVSQAALLNRRKCSLSAWSLDPGSQIENIDDPNTPFGFGPGQITDRKSMLKVNPLATLVANRDTISDIGNGVRMPAMLRHGSVVGNRWALVVPLAQPVTLEAEQRGKLMADGTTLQCLPNGKDAVTRDTDRVLVFY